MSAPIRFRTFVWLLALVLGGCSMLFETDQTPNDAGNEDANSGGQLGDGGYLDANSSDAGQRSTLIIRLGAVGPNAGQVSISNQEGIFCNLPLCEFSFPAGSALQLYASPPDVFTSWELSGPCATTTNQNTAIVPLTADCGAIASFGTSAH